MPSGLCKNAKNATSAEPDTKMQPQTIQSLTEALKCDRNTAPTAMHT